MVDIHYYGSLSSGEKSILSRMITRVSIPVQAGNTIDVERRPGTDVGLNTLTLSCLAPTAVVAQFGTVHEAGQPQPSR